MRGAVRHEYESLAPRYDRRWAAYIAATATATLSRLPGDLPAAGRFLDVACGTGVLLEQLFSRFGDARAFAGIDVAPAMLRVARGRLPLRVGLAVGEAERLPVASSCFDLVLSMNAWHCFRRPEQALREAHRVLVPGGRLLVTDWCADFALVRGRWWALRLAGRPLGTLFSTSSLAAALLHAGFGDVRVERHRASWSWGMMTAVARASGAAERRVATTRLPPRDR